ncbi:MAG: hypothetical protein KJO35_09485, partial [Gammaproteobacteria bacterium]|nr:hypothetical protein [Gammaproteobacteria bacterium]
RSDGTPAGTQLVRDLGDFTFGVDQLEYLNGSLWFGTRGSSNGSTFWTSDGTPGGTVPVINYSESSGPVVIDIALAGDTVVFAVDTGFDSEHLLYRTDGTLAGTEQFATFADPLGNLPPMATFGDWLIFIAERAGFGSEGREVWRTDATAAGTEIVADIRPGSFHSSSTELTTVGDRVYFAATAPDQAPGLDRELWMTDGTTAGTQQVFEINPTGSSSPTSLVATADAVVFTAVTPEAGRELWLSRGPDDTYQIVDLYPGPEDSDISGPVAVGGTVFFQANDNVSGEELWRSDGTLAGTRLAADVVPGSGGSAPADLAFVNGVLYFTADDGVHGREIWALTTNIAPWFTTLPSESAIENIEYSYTAAVTDINAGDTLTLTIVDAPAGVLFDPQTGLLTWSPTTDQVGLNSFSLVVTDQGGESATQTLRIDVLADTDADTLPDVQDNCSVIENTDQRDTDGDGFGNLCDADLDGSCNVDFGDLMLFKVVFFSNDPDADFDGDGTVNFIDLELFQRQFFAPPGPSGLADCS